MTSAESKIERCSAQMLLAYPWWASLYLNLVRVETMTVSTMAVDGTRLFFNPVFTESLTDRECLGVLMHETAHCALLHIYRRRHREPERWNVACDKAVNALVLAAGITLPKDCVPPAPLGALAEELYENITAGEMKLYFPDLLEAGTGPSTDTPKLDEGKWRDIVAASRGLMPAYAARTIDDATAPQKDWRAELARFIHATKKADSHTWTRVSRRISGMPGWHREIESRIAICVDTSGSISSDMLNAFMSECRAITALAGITAVLITCDAEVSEVVLPGEPFPEEIQGGGGTSFIPALEEAQKHEPNGIVYLTDGAGEYPKSCLYPVLWTLTQPFKVPFGESIIL
jgi:predicted metal-dependent peptidase